MYLYENESAKRIADLEERVEKLEELVHSLSCRIDELEDLNSEPSHSEGWYMT